MKIPKFNVGDVVKCIKQDGTCRVGENILLRELILNIILTPLIVSK